MRNMKKIYTLCLILFIGLSVFQPKAQIIYYPFVPAYDLWFPRVVDVDLDKNTQNDYIINAGKDDTSHFVRMTSNNMSQVLVTVINGNNYPKALNLGDSINGSKTEWVTIPSSPTTWFYLICRGNGGSHGNYGLWWGQSNKYLGVRVNKNGDWYYGWIELTITQDTTSAAQNKVYGRAYNSTLYGTLTAGQKPSGVAENIQFGQIYSSGKKLICKFDQKLPENIMILNTFGQVLMQKQIDSENMEFDMSSYKSGIYIVKVFSKNQSYTTRLLLK